MKKMQESEFEEIEATVKDPKNCKHDVWKLYYGGAHTDYGCIKCKMTSRSIDDFLKKNN